MISNRPLAGTVVDDPLQISPLITQDRKILQGSITGILRVS
ncbi:hypothetical protein AB0L63_09550 [Nocardia sp. NPDC051990]